MTNESQRQERQEQIWQEMGQQRDSPPERVLGTEQERRGPGESGEAGARPVADEALKGGLCGAPEEERRAPWPQAARTT